MRASSSGIAVVTALSILTASANAQGLGGLLMRLLARGAIIAGQSQTERHAPKIYSSDVLTVEQLALCIKQATKLDADHERIEGDRKDLLSSKTVIDAANYQIEMQRATLDHHDKRSVDALNVRIDRFNGLVTSEKAKQDRFNFAVDTFNTQINTYNAACEKRYYADDLPDAQKLAAQH